MSWLILALVAAAVWKLFDINYAVRASYQLQLEQLKETQAAAAAAERQSVALRDLAQAVRKQTKATRDVAAEVRAHLAWCQRHFEAAERTHTQSEAGDDLLELFGDDDDDEFVT